ncbi:MAG: RNA polymerase sigma-70 factor (ECF subfamily) [Desulforhopalus sp.]|jgi:RNA polymerase sigma-70 factor (ECF subfamily)
MKKFQSFYTDNKDKLFGYLLRKTGNSHLAADLVQEAFTRYLERYRTREQSIGLLFTIGRNLFYDQMRQKSQWIPREDLAQESVGNQEQKYIDKEELGAVFAALEKLGDDERDVLAMVVSSGLTYEEIAHIRKCSVANIKVKVHRARKKLKEYLRENNNV